MLVSQLMIFGPQLIRSARRFGACMARIIIPRQIAAFLPFWNRLEPQSQDRENSFRLVRCGQLSAIATRLESEKARRDDLWLYRQRAFYRRSGSGSLAFSISRLEKRET